MSDEVVPGKANELTTKDVDPDFPLRTMPHADAPWYIERAWEHAMHEDGLFHSHLDVFLVFESLLLAGVSALIGSEKAPEGLATALAIYGLASCGYWALVQRRARFILFHLTNTLEDDPYYAAIVKARRDLKYPWHLRKMKNWSMLGYGLPAGVAGLWAVILWYL